MLRATSQSEDWSSALYDRQPWTILFVAGFWFQDLFSYELHNIQMSTAVVVDGGLDPERVQNAEVSFSFKNAGGWRQVAEWARHAPTLSQWHGEHGRHRIYANGQFVSIGQLRPTPGIVDEYFNGSTGDGDEGDTDMRGPWESSYGLHVVEPELDAPGGGLSVRDINGKIDGEERGKQDDAQKATTSPGMEAIGKNGAGSAEAKNGRGGNRSARSA